MNITCEMFMDCVYKEDIAMEGVHPVFTIKRVCRRIIDEIMKLINRTRGLRKIVIPKKHKRNFEYIRFTLAEILSNLDKDLSYISSKLDELQKSKLYQDFFAAERKNAALKKSDFLELENPKELISTLNNSIDMLRKFENDATNPELGDDVKEIARVLIRVNTIHIKAINKVLSFSAPRKDPKNIQSLDAPINAKVNIV